MDAALGRRSAWVAVLLLTAVVMVFAALRVLVDAPNILDGRIPPADEFDSRYAQYPWLAYAHIAPGVVYLLIAPFQLSRGFRNRNLARHRRMGRLALGAGLTSGVMGVVFGAFLSFGGLLEATAAVLFGSWFVWCLLTAYRFVRAGDIRSHRRWMIRAFAVGLAVGTIRAWIGLFQGLDLLTFRESFGVAFWLSFALHALAAEAWLRWRPAVSGGPRA